MADFTNVLQRIAAGEIVPQGPQTVKVSAGEFTCIATAAAFGRGNKGTLTGQITFKVIAGGTDQEVGGEFKKYVQTQNLDYLSEELAVLYKMLVDSGYPAAKIQALEYEDAADLVGQIMNLINRLAIKGKIKCVIRRKPQDKMAQNGSPYYYNDILSTIPVDGEAPVAPAPLPAAPAPVSPAQMTAVAALAAPGAKTEKPWA